MSTSTEASSLITSPLITAENALTLLQNCPPEHRVTFVDASWFLDKTKKPYEDYVKKRIKNAIYFEIDKIADQNTTLPHMLPSPAEFENHMTSLGITSRDIIIVYNTQMSVSAARVWWTFKTFSHKNVYVLQGGIDAWIAAGGEVDSGPLPESSSQESQPHPGEFKAALDKRLLASKDDVLKVVTTGIAQICDARSEGRFLGREPEPRQGLLGGHIPGSLNIPFGQVLDPTDITKYKSVDDIKAVFEKAGIIPGSKVLFSCGSGITASVLAFARYYSGEPLENNAVYDGSWSEWGAEEAQLPIVTDIK